MPEPPYSGFVIAASGTESGKTTLTLALLAAFMRRGLSPRAFKVGPDPLDSGLHAGIVTPAHSARIPNPGRNLDGWLYSREHCRAIFERHMAPAPDGVAPVAVVEGVMGLFDGADPVEERGSTAEMAKWLDLPVLLVLNARGAGRTIAATLQGLTGFDPGVRYLGAVCNFVGSERHEEGLRRTLGTLCPHIPLLGCLPKIGEITLASRHLGLGAAHEGILAPAFLDALVAWVESALDVEELLVQIGAGKDHPRGSAPALMPENIPLVRETVSPSLRSGEKPVRLGVSCDEALYFLNEDTLHELRVAGAELVFFSPLHDETLPPDLDGLYLCGGYPELYTGELSVNTPMLQSIRSFTETGRCVWAAGGGFLLLLASFAVPFPDVASPSTPFAMGGIFNGHAVLEPRLQALGYRELRQNAATIFGPPGAVLRGNEYRYSRLHAMDQSHPVVFNATGRDGRDLGPAGYTLASNPNVLGTFVHIHLGGTPGAAEHFIALMASTRKGRA